MWLPSWPTQRLRRTGTVSPDRPLATVETVRGLRRLAAICPLAAARGLWPEQALAEARAICPDLVAMDADPAVDRLSLAKLAAWCERYTPLAAVDPPDGLWLDITGCAHLFGNENSLANDLTARLARSGLTCRVAVASTAGTAWALGRAATMRTTCTFLPHGQERRALSALPVALLRLDPHTVAGLRRVGLKSIGELGRLPRTELTSHFGQMPGLRLDQALGFAAESISWPRPLVSWREHLAFAEVIGTPEDLARAIAVLTDRLCALLLAQNLGGLRFTTTFFRADGECERIDIATALPTRDAAYITKLLAAKLETVDPGFGIDLIRMDVEETEALNAHQTTFGAPADPGKSKLAVTVDQLTNRLGEKHVWRAAPRESHLPERAVQHVPPLSARRISTIDPSAERPVRLFRRPEPIEVTALVPDAPPLQFRWRGALHRVRAASGPERIGAEWWRRGPQPHNETEHVRDYYRVEDSDGSRFWIFRAGLHDGGTVPHWFLHGLFG